MVPVFPPASRSLAKKYLTASVFEQLGSLKTLSGFTIDQAIASGIANPDSSIGIYAGDAASYTLFAPVFDPIIQDYHKVPPDLVHQGDVSSVDLPDIDPHNRFILSTRIRVARSLSGFPFTNHLNLDQRKKLEQTVLRAIPHLEGDLKGEYLSLERESSDLLAQYQQKHLIFPKGDRFQAAAGMNKDFPKCRGVYLSQDRSFRIWVNEEDHLRIMSLSQDANFTAVFNRLKRGLDILANHLDFLTHKQYGYLNACPTNIGTAMRAGVHIRLKKLEQRPGIIESIAKQYQLQIRGTRGEKTAVDDAVFDISNKRRLGISESQIIKLLYKGVQALIDAEQAEN